MSKHPISIAWKSTSRLPPRRFECGYCNSVTASSEGFTVQADLRVFAYLCGGCNRPTYFEGNEQTPPPMLGDKVNNLPSKLELLYEEARRCAAVGAYTGCVMCCRKLLMHIAVDQGAGTTRDWNFFKYVEFLDENRYIPPNGRAWVDYVRTKGNEANHEIMIMKKADAEMLLSFIEMLLRIIYDFGTLVASTLLEENDDTK